MPWREATPETDFLDGMSKHITSTQVNKNTTWEHIKTPYGDCTVDIKSSEIYRGPVPCVHLYWLVAKAQGAGRYSLNLVCGEADKAGVAIELYALPLGGGAYKPTSEQLIRFYRSFGFVVKGKDKEGVPWMLRLPKKAK